MAEGTCAVREDQAWELLAYLTASAELCITEPHYYGTFRLIEAASRLVGFMLDHADSERSWLRGFKSEIDEKKLWMLRDREAYFEFLKAASAKLAVHVSIEAENDGPV
jgi:hypothetical protein